MRGGIIYLDRSVKERIAVGGLGHRKTPAKQGRCFEVVATREEPGQEPQEQEDSAFFAATHVGLEVPMMLFNEVIQ